LFGFPHTLVKTVELAVTVSLPFREGVRGEVDEAAGN